MTEREIIIEGLESRQRFKTPDGSSCVISANLLQDALALLKAQGVAFDNNAMAEHKARRWVARIREEARKNGADDVPIQPEGGAGAPD